MKRIKFGFATFFSCHVSLLSIISLFRSLNFASQRFLNESVDIDEGHWINFYSHDKHKISKKIISHFKFPISFFSFPIPLSIYSFPLPIPHSLFPIPYSLFPIPYFPFPIPYFLFPIPYSLFSIPHSPYPIPHSSFSISHSSFLILVSIPILRFLFSIAHFSFIISHFPSFHCTSSFYAHSNELSLKTIGLLLSSFMNCNFNQWNNMQAEKFLGRNFIIRIARVSYV